MKKRKYTKKKKKKRKEKNEKNENFLFANMSGVVAYSLNSFECCTDTVPALL